MVSFTVFLFLANPPRIIIAKGWAGGNRVGFVQSNLVNMGVVGPDQRTPCYNKKHLKAVISTLRVFNKLHRLSNS